jgi:predicted phosphodiesterase
LRFMTPLGLAGWRRLRRIGRHWQMTVSQEIISNLIRRFPGACSQTLARMAYQENPSVWKDEEGARWCVRYMRGAGGDKNRRNLAVREFMREPKQQGDPFGKLPKAIGQLDDWHAVQIDGPLHVGVIADLHIPYHNSKAVMLALEDMRERGVDTILMNGDIADFYAVSFWETDPRRRKFKDEVEAVKQFLQVLRDGFPKARLIYKLGNHEERFERYMRVKAPELLDVADFEITSLFEFDALRIECVRDKRPVRLGQLNVLHGHEYRFAISNPVNPARGLLLRAKSHSMCGHFHRSSHDSGKNIEEKTVGAWSTGCLCEMHPEYAPLNNWNLGHAFVQVDRTGKFQVSNRFIGDDGKVY